MVELSEIEARLAAMFQAVARQVPDKPPADELPEDELAELGVDGRDSTELADEELADAGAPLHLPRAARHRNWRSFGAGAGLVAAVVAVGTGVAAATGMLSPSAVQLNLDRVLTPAMSILGSTNPASVPGAIVRVTTPGPEGTVLQVVSDNGDNDALAAGLCDTLTVSTPSGALAPGAAQADQGGCDMVGVMTVGNSLSATQLEQSSLGPQMQRTEWLAPSGHGYTIVFGDAPAGTSFVALTGSSGDIGAEVQADSGWYAVYIPSAQFSTFDYLTFLNSTGQATTSNPLNT